MRSSGKLFSFVRLSSAFLLVFGERNAVSLHRNHDKESFVITKHCRIQFMDVKQWERLANASIARRLMKTPLKGVHWVSFDNPLRILQS